MNQHYILTFIAFVIGFAAGAIGVSHDAEREKLQAIEKYKEDSEKVHDLVLQRMKLYEDLWLTCDAQYTALVKDSVFQKALPKEKAKRLQRAK